MNIQKMYYVITTGIKNGLKEVMTVCKKNTGKTKTYKDEQPSAFKWIGLSREIESIY